MIGIQEALEIVKKLRSPEGCPWDREQTHESLRTHLLEECYEVLEVLDGGKPNNYDEALSEELGDLLLQILLHCQIAEERGAFSFYTVAKKLGQKLVHRHPHVFDPSKKKAKDATEVTENWEKSKQPRKQTLSDIPLSLPSLQRAQKVIERVSRVGFQWPNLEGPLAKVKEEYDELVEEIRAFESDELPLDPGRRKNVEKELGDLLFTIANVAYFLKVNPESALREMLLRFSNRFSYVEQKARESNRALDSFSLDELDVFWEEAKRTLKD
jgi:tetrapyrrole methylase family protein / MazG family protein